MCMKNTPSEPGLTFYSTKSKKDKKPFFAFKYTIIRHRIYNLKVSCAVWNISSYLKNYVVQNMDPTRTTYEKIVKIYKLLTSTCLYEGDISPYL